MVRGAGLWLVAGWMCVVSLGCEAPKSSIEARHAGAIVASKPAEEVKAKGEEVAPSHRYSPFVLDVKSSGSIFKRVSFKDVGVRSAREEQRSALYEALAEELALELGREPKLLMMPASVSYDEAILDPHNHLACGADHLYVDVWEGDAPKRWGYSLWSGCGDEDNFAWKEVAFTPHPHGDMIQDLKPLTQSIVASIREASERGCYQKTC